MRKNVPLKTLYLWSFFSLLVGLMFFDKTFAYIGLGKVYLSHIVLLLGLVAGACVTVGRLRSGPHHLSGSWPLGILALFLAYEAFRTVVDLPHSGRMALRDGAVWGFGVFAVVLVLLVNEKEMVHWLLKYRRLVPYFVLWAPVALLLSVFRPDRLILPGTNVSLYLYKTGDIAVHLTGVALAIVLWRYPKNLGLRMVLLLPWGLAWFLVANLSRGATLASVLGIGVAMAVAPRREGLGLVAAVALVWLAFAATGARIVVPPRGEGALPKEISAENLTRTFSSLGDLTTHLVSDIRPHRTGVVKSSSVGQKAVGLTAEREGVVNHQSLSSHRRPVKRRSHLRLARVFRGGTVAWRLRWWRKIIGYAVFGPYRWTGKGFGVNLADDDGFQVRADHRLRDPHNVFMTFLARSGLPGLLLFTLVICAVLIMAVRALTKARTDSVFLVWALGYFIACLIDGCFDVYVENPMGGVWFWTLLGTVLVLSEGLISRGEGEGLGGGIEEPPRG